MAENANLPVLTLDFDDEQIAQLQQIVAEFKKLRFTSPSGESNAPAIPPAAAPEEPRNNSNGSESAGGREFRRFVEGIDGNSRRTLRTFRAINRELSITTDALGELFSTSVKWGVALAGIAAAGPLGYGSIASRVSESVQRAQGYNVSPGTLQAAEATYGTYFSNVTGSFSQLAAAQFDPSNPLYAGLMAIGLDPRGNPADIYPQFLQRVGELSEQYQDQGVALQYINSLGLGSVITPDVLNQINANRERLPGLQAQYSDAQARNDVRLNPDVTQGYQAVSSSLALNADNISNSFLNALSRLQGPIIELSDELTDLITGFLEGENGQAVFESIGDGLRQLAAWLGSDEFQSDLREFGQDLSAAAKGLRDFIAWLAEFFGQDSSQLAAYGAGGAAALGVLGAGGVRGAVAAGGRIATGTTGLVAGALSFSPLTALPLAALPVNDIPTTSEEFRNAGVKPWWEVNPPVFDENGLPVDTSVADVGQRNYPLLSGGQPVARGIRNNNPGNLRFAGQRGAIPDSDGFAVFPDKSAGIAALDRQLSLYMSRGMNSIEDIISTYAPQNENDTEEYIKFVSNRTGIDRRQKLDPNDVVSTSKIIRSIIDMEQGKQGQSISNTDIARSVAARRNIPLVPLRNPIEVEITHQPGSDFRAQVISQSKGN